MRAQKASPSFQLELKFSICTFCTHTVYESVNPSCFVLRNKSRDKCLQCKQKNEWKLGNEMRLVDVLQPQNDESDRIEGEGEKSEKSRRKKEEEWNRTLYPRVLDWHHCSRKSLIPEAERDNPPPISPCIGPPLAVAEGSNVLLLTRPHKSHICFFLSFWHDVWTTPISDRRADRARIRLRFQFK